MSCTEIYIFDKSGKASLYDDSIHNAHRGAMAIWNIMERKYLPQYIPDYYVNVPRNEWRFTPSRTCHAGNAFQEIIALWENPKVSRTDKIVLVSTFDMAIVKKENLQELIDAFMQFNDGIGTSLPEQAEVLRRILNDDNVIAVGWNQTSVNSDTWDTIGGTDEETGEEFPYNINTMDKHFFLFQELFPDEEAPNA